jgi:hypothetical protein
LQLQIHQNRWLKLAREGGQMTVQHLRDLENTRRYATLPAVLLEVKATLIDQALDLHDRMIGALFNRAKRRHAEEFQQSGEAIHEKVRLYWRIGEALLQARQSGVDPFHAIEAIISWEAFVQSVTEAQRLAQVEGFDYLRRISEGYTQIRRYAPAFLNAFQFKAAPPHNQSLKRLKRLRRWTPIACAECLLIHRQISYASDGERWCSPTLAWIVGSTSYAHWPILKNALRSVDIWVQGSRQFKDFDEYLIPSELFAPFGESAFARSISRQQLAAIFSASEIVCCLVSMRSIAYLPVSYCDTARSMRGSGTSHMRATAT